MNPIKTVDAAFRTPHNAQVLREFFIGIASGKFFDGQAHKLYFDAEAGCLFAREASSLCVTSDDESIVMVTQLMGCCDLAESELYRPGMDLEEFGFTDWMADMKQQIQLRIEPLSSSQLYSPDPGVLQ